MYLLSYDIPFGRVYGLTGLAVKRDELVDVEAGEARKPE